MILLQYTVVDPQPCMLNCLSVLIIAQSDVCYSIAIASAMLVMLSYIFTKKI